MTFLESTIALYDRSIQGEPFNINSFDQSSVFCVCSFDPRKVCFTVRSFNPSLVCFTVCSFDPQQACFTVHSFDPILGEFTSPSVSVFRIRIFICSDQNNGIFMEMCKI